MRRSDGPLAGYLVYSEVLDELHIMNLAVHPAVRRKGLARLLMTKVHADAQRRGRVISYLEVRQSNSGAQKLYTDFGYRPLGKRKDYYSDNHEDAIVMCAEFGKEKASP